MKFTFSVFVLLSAVGMAVGQAAVPVVSAPVPEVVTLRESPKSPPVPRERTRVAVLGYGKIGEGKVALSPAAFEQQMMYLRESGMSVISPSDFIAWRAGTRMLPAQCVLLTFDKADDGFAQHALPVLQRCEFPFLVFADGGNVYARPGELNPDSLRDMQLDGAEIGSQTLRRPYAMEWQMAQIAGEARSRKLVEDEIGHSSRLMTAAFGACRFFAYPWGYSDDVMRAALAEFDYAVAFTRSPEKAFATTDPYMQPRYMVKNDAVFARAVNFGAPADVAAVLDSLKACRPALDIAPAAVAANVVMPVFSDDDVAEEVEDEEIVLPAGTTATLASAGTPEVPAPASTSVPVLAPGPELNPETNPTNLPVVEDPAPPAPAPEPAPAPAPEPAPAPAPEPAPAPAPEPAPAPAPEPAPAPAPEPAPAPAPEPAPAPAPEPAPAPAPEPAPAPAPEPAPAPAPAPAPEPAPAPAPEPAPAPQTESASASAAEEYPEVEALVGNLGKRSADGDWVTSSFAQPLVPREKTRVAVLGYHNFSKTRPCTEMRMSTADFCRQMQFLKDSSISVISMQDFLEWRCGTRRLPERCVLITIDDGWKSVHAEAFPVLKAYGFPFTLYLYTRYINVKGDSMTSEQIREMMAHGATIGSHSSNHLYPSKWKRYKQNSPQYAAQLQKELADSRAKLREMFGNCSTYCYPGGYNTPPMHETLAKAQYKAAFTVIEKKVGCEEPLYQVHRYMVFGTNHEIFRRAVNFDDVAGVAATRAAIAAADKPAKAFFPAAYEGCTNRVPLAPVKTTPASVKTAPAAPAVPSAPAAPGVPNVPATSAPAESATPAQEVLSAPAA